MPPVLFPGKQAGKEEDVLREIASSTARIRDPKGVSATIVAMGPGVKHLPAAATTREEGEPARKGTFDRPVMHGVGGNNAEGGDAKGGSRWRHARIRPLSPHPQTNPQMGIYIKNKTTPV